MCKGPIKSESGFIFAVLSWKFLLNEIKRLSNENEIEIQMAKQIDINHSKDQRCDFDSGWLLRKIDLIQVVKKS